MNQYNADPATAKKQSVHFLYFMLPLKEDPFQEVAQGAGDAQAAAVQAAGVIINKAGIKAN